MAVDTDHQKYHPGDDVRLRVSVTNETQSTVDIFNGSPWAEVSIAVIDGAGSIIEPSGAIDNRTYHDLEGGGAVEIAPGKSWVFEWDGQQWASLSHWGYALPNKGTYTIRATPRMLGFFSTPEHLTQGSRFTVPRSAVRKDPTIELLP